MSSTNRKINMITVFLLLLMVVVATAFVYALFSGDKKLDNSITLGDMKMSVTGTSNNIPVASINKPYDKVSTTLTVTNTGIKTNGDANFYYEITAALTTNDGATPTVLTEYNELDDVLLVYFDGQLQGTLGQIKKSPIKVTNPLVTKGTAADMSTNNSRTHIIDLEYHLGAEPINNTNFTLKFTANAIQADKTTTFVSNLAELEQIALYATNVKRIVLLDNIVITKIITLQDAQFIDLNGYAITMAENVDYLKYKVTAFQSEFVAFMNKSLDANVNFSPINDFGIYLTADRFTFIEPSSKLITYNKTTPEDTLPSMIRFNNSSDIANTEFCYVTYALSEVAATDPKDTVIHSFVKSVTVRGKGDKGVAQDIFDAAIANIGYTEGAESSLVRRINGDVFLPSRAHTVDAQIKWLSSNTSVLSDSGIFVKPYTATNIDLSAIISFKGKTYAFTQSLSAVHKTNREKFDEFVAINTLAFTKVGEEKNLAELKKINDMGFASITFSVDGYPMFSLTDNKATGNTLTDDILTLAKETDITKAKLSVKATFADDTIEPITIYSGSIAVDINIVKTSDTFAKVYAVIEGILAPLGNTLSSFKLPGYYIDKNTLITYEVVSPVNQNYITIVPSVAKVEGTEISGVAGSGHPEYYTIEFDVMNLPQVNTEVKIKATVTVSSVAEPRTKDFSFMAAGVLHNSAEDISDFNLFTSLCKSYNSPAGGGLTSNFLYITRDTIDSSKIDTLDFNGKFITSLSGIGYFTNIKTLNLSKNVFSDISALRSLTLLEDLDISNNGVIDVSALADLTNMKKLLLNNNSIGNISALANLTELITLEVDNNTQISRLELLEKLDNLQTFSFINTIASGLTIGGQVNAFPFNMNYVISAYQRAVANPVIAANVHFYRNYKSNTTTREEYIPSTDLKDGNALLNGITEIYEIRNVISLPFDVYYKNTSEKVVSLAITWSEDGTNVVTFSTDANGNKSATITRPIADINIYLVAKITYNGNDVYRRFKVLSREDSTVKLTIQSATNSSVYIDAKTAIPDDELRYRLFQLFDTNTRDNKIMQAEIKSSKRIFDLTNLGITNIKGIELFGAGISELNLRGNLPSDISYLSQLTNLTRLTIDNGNHSLTSLEGLKSLTYLSVFGMEGLDETAKLNSLFKVFTSNSTNKIKIYKDSASIEWNPYLEPLRKALTRIQGVYLLGAGATITLANAIDVDLYGTIYSLNLNYSYSNPGTNNTNLDPYILSGNNKVLSYPYSAAMLSVDKSFVMNVSISHFNGTVVLGTASTKVVVMAITDNDIKIDISSTTAETDDYQNLIDILPNYAARKSIMNKVADNGKISKASRESINTLTFDAKYGINFSGGKYFPNVTSLIIEGYSYSGTELATMLTLANFPKVTSLIINNSYVDMNQLLGLKGNLTSLTLFGCTTIIMEKTGTTDSVWGEFTKLTTLKLNGNNIKELGTLTTLRVVKTLYLYDNPASIDSRNNGYLLQIYKNQGSQIDIDYRIDNSFVLWTALDVESDDFFVYSSNAAEFKNTLDEANYITKPTSGAVTTINRNLSLNGKTIAWTSSNTSAVINSTSGSTAITFTHPTDVAYSYVVLTATVADLAVTEQFVFVLEGIGTHTAGYLNLSDFMLKDSNGTVIFQFTDPQFANKMLMAIDYGDKTGDNLGAGKFNSTRVQSVNTLEFTMAAFNKKFSSINDIRGIKNFTGLTTLTFSKINVGDFTELYHLINLTSLTINDTQLDNLYFSKTSDTVWAGLFDRMTALTTLTLTNNYINDFTPLTTAGGTVALKLTFYNSTTIQNGFYINNDKYFDTLIALNKRTNVTLFLNTNNTTLNKTDFEAFLTSMKAIAQTGTDAKVPLKLSYAGKELNLSWLSYSSGTGISINSTTGSITLLSSMTKTNHSYDLVAYTSFSGIEFSRLITFQYTGNANESLTIQLVDGTNVDATTLIPDDNLRNLLFYTFAGNDSNISYAERRTSESIAKYITANNRSIRSLKGIELFPNVKSWNFSHNLIEEIPALSFDKDTSFSLDLSSNYALKSLDKMTKTDETKNPTGAISFAQSITTLTMNNSPLLDDDTVNNNLSQMTKVTEIRMTASKVSRFTFPPALYKTLIVMPAIKSDFVQLNNNYQYLRELIVKNWKLDMAKVDSEITWRIGNMSRKIIASYVETSSIGTDGKYIKLIDTTFANGTTTELPSEYTMNGQKYDLIWSEATASDSFNIINNNNGTYSIEVSANPTEIITPRVTLSYTDNSAGGDNKTHSNYYEDINLKTGNVAPSGDLYEKIGGKWLADNVPDVFLRMAMMSQVIDQDNANDLTAADLVNGKLITKLGTFVVGNKTQSVSNLKGIELLGNVTSLTISYADVSDFSYIKDFTSLTSLSIDHNKATIHDFSFMNAMKSLAAVNFNLTDYDSFSFLMELPNLKTIELLNKDSSITADGDSGGVRYSGFLKNAYAYARMSYVLTEDSNLLTTIPSSGEYTSTAAQKQAALILSSITENLVAGQKSEMIFDANSTLSGKLSYYGKTYDVKYVSMSPRLTFAPTPSTEVATSYVPTVIADNYRSIAGFVAQIEIDGEVFERYFFTRIPRVTPALQLQQGGDR